VQKIITLTPYPTRPEPQVDSPDPWTTLLEGIVATHNYNWFTALFKDNARHVALNS